MTQNPKTQNPEPSMIYGIGVDLVKVARIEPGPFALRRPFLRPGVHGA